MLKGHWRDVSKLISQHLYETSGKNQFLKRITAKKRWVKFRGAGQMTGMVQSAIPTISCLFLSEHNFNTTIELAAASMAKD